MVGEKPTGANRRYEGKGHTHTRMQNCGYTRDVKINIPLGGKGGWEIHPKGDYYCLKGLRSGLGILVRRSCWSSLIGNAAMLLSE